MCTIEPERKIAGDQLAAAPRFGFVAGDGDQPEIREAVGAGRWAAFRHVTLAIGVVERTRVVARP